jgi:hypothetical protein
MNVEIGTEATEFPEKEYINGIFAAVHFILVSQRGVYGPEKCVIVFSFKGDGWFM